MEDAHQDFVHDFLTVHELAEVKGVGLGTEQGLTATEEAVGDADGSGARGTYDAYGTPLGCGDGADGSVVHISQTNNNGLWSYSTRQPIAKFIC